MYDSGEMSSVAVGTALMAQAVFSYQTRTQSEPKVHQELMSLQLLPKRQDGKPEAHNMT